MPNIKLTKFLEKVHNLHYKTPRNHSIKERFQREVLKAMNECFPDWDETHEEDDPFEPFTNCSDTILRLIGAGDYGSKDVDEILKKHFLYDHLLALAAQEDALPNAKYSPVILAIFEQLL